MIQSLIHFIKVNSIKFNTFKVNFIKVNSIKVNSFKVDSINDNSINSKKKKMKKKDGIIFRFFSTFTMDVISKCAFGMQIDNLGEKDDPFMKNAQTVFNPPVNKSPLIVIPCNH